MLLLLHLDPSKAQLRAANQQTSRPRLGAQGVSCAHM